MFLQILIKPHVPGTPQTSSPGGEARPGPVRRSSESLSSGADVRGPPFVTDVQYLHWAVPSCLELCYLETRSKPSVSSTS